MTKQEIESHLDWLEYKYTFKVQDKHRELLYPIYNQIILSALQHNYLLQEIEDDFKLKILSRFNITIKEQK